MRNHTLPKPLIEICVGDPQRFQQIPFFPGVDVEELARDWGFDYALNKNFSLFELVEKNIVPEMAKPHNYSCRLFYQDSVPK